MTRIDARTTPLDTPVSFAPSDLRALDLKLQPTEVQTGVQFSSFHAALKLTLLGVHHQHLAISASVAEHAPFELEALLPNQHVRVHKIEAGSRIPANAATVIVSPDDLEALRSPPAISSNHRLIVASPSPVDRLSLPADIQPDFVISGAQYTGIARDSAISYHRTARSMGYSLGIMFFSAEEALKVTSEALTFQERQLGGNLQPALSLNQIGIEPNLFGSLDSLYNGEHSVVVCDSRVHALDLSLLELIGTLADSSGKDRR